MIFKTIQKALQRNASTILIWTGIFGFGVSCVATAKAYTECKELVKKKKEELKVDKLPVKEVVKTCWKPCVLPLLTFSTSTICVLGSRNIILKEKAALAALYKASETALTEFKNETKKIAGEETFKKIEQEAVKNQASNNQNFKETSNEVILDKPLFYDPYKDKYFRSTVTDIQDVFHDIHDRMTDRNSFEDEVSYADLYYELYNGSTAERLDDWGYYSKDYSYRNKFKVTFGDYYVIAPNGERAIPIFYDHPKMFKKDSEL